MGVILISLKNKYLVIIKINVLWFVSLKNICTFATRKKRDIYKQVIFSI